MQKIQIFYKKELREMNQAIDILCNKCERCSDLRGVKFYHVVFYITLLKPIFCRARIPVAINYDEDIAALLIVDGTDPSLVAKDILTQLGFPKRGRIYVFDSLTYNAFKSASVEGFEKPRIIFCEMK